MPKRMQSAFTRADLACLWREQWSKRSSTHFRSVINPQTRGWKLPRTFPSKAYWPKRPAKEHWKMYLIEISNDWDGHLHSWTRCLNVPWPHLGSSDRSPNIIGKNVRDRDDEKKKEPKQVIPSFPDTESPLASSRASRFSSKDDTRNKAKHQRRETISNPSENKTRKQHCKYKTSKL